MKKRLLTGLLTLVMVLSIGSVLVLAEEKIELTDAGGDLESGNYILNSDIQLKQNIVVPEGAEVSIDLNGHTITGLSGDAPVITVNGTFILKDTTAETGAADGEENSVGTSKEESTGRYRTFYAETTETGGGDFLTTYYCYSSGAVTGGNNNKGHGGGVLVGAAGTFVMENGTITGNMTGDGKSGGGVRNDGNFIMDGGAISNNVSYNGGGVENRGVFIMNNGVICKNTAETTDGRNGFGGGVRQYCGTFEMRGGSIQYNEAKRIGGGVFNNGNAVEGKSDCSFTLKNGTILFNKANGESSYGGGVGVLFADVVISGGTIYGNEAARGGGIYLYGADTSFKLESGTIAGNEASQNGGGIYLENKENMLVELYGGSVIKNNSDWDGGGIYVSGEKISLKVGGDVYVTDNFKGGSKNNICLPNSSIFVTAEKELTGKIGISTTADPGTPVVKGTDTYLISYSDSDAFYCDKDTQVLVKDENTLKLYLSDRTYKIEYSANFENVQENVKQYIPNSGKAVLRENIFVNDGYAFTGWNTERNGTGNGYTDKEEIYISSDMVLYAQWSLALPEVEITPASSTVNIGESAELGVEITNLNENITYTYQWYAGETNSNTEGNELNGATGPKYSPEVSSLGTTYYYCVVTANADGEVRKTTTSVVPVTVVNGEEEPAPEKNPQKHDTVTVEIGGSSEESDKANEENPNTGAPVNTGAAAAFTVISLTCILFSKK